MYKGLARLVGMEIVGKAQTLAEQIEVLKQNWAKYDFFFIHFKYTDSTGEDGNFAAKVKRIEELDAAMPQITALNPTVLIVTGDHSTPAKLKSHSWHPVPTLLVSDVCRTDACEKFGENECLRGGLGQFEAKYLMPLALANAGRLGKYGVTLNRRDVFGQEEEKSRRLRKANLLFCSSHSLLSKCLSLCLCVSAVSIKLTLSRRPAPVSAGRVPTAQSSAAESCRA